MRSQLQTYYLRTLINQLLDSTVTQPSLAEFVQHHLMADWLRLSPPAQSSLYIIRDTQEVFMELEVIDSSGYADLVYQRGQVLLQLAVNGILINDEDEAQAQELFPNRPFRTCQYCGLEVKTWFEYYGHVNVDHLPEQAWQ